MSPEACHRPPNFLVIVSDEERHWSMIDRLLPNEAARKRFWGQLPARRWLRDHGLSFKNHHTPTVPCSPARSVLYTGHHAPDTQLVDNMEILFQASLGRFEPHPHRRWKRLDDDCGPPTLGHILSDLGYYTAYKGKVHLASDCVLSRRDAMLERYGFNDWNGTVRNIKRQDFEGPQAGYWLDGGIAKDAARWLKEMPHQLRLEGTPWFLAVNFINPHDIMLVDVDGAGIMQVMQSPSYPIAPVPLAYPYNQWWEPKEPQNFDAHETGPRPGALDEWASVTSVTFGNIPFVAPITVHGKYMADPAIAEPWMQDDPTAGAADFTDVRQMWKAYLNYYLNCLIDSDRHINEVLKALPFGEWDNTFIIFVSDHGEMGMSHKGDSRYARTAAFPRNTTGAGQELTMPLRQKGPFVYAENNRVPFIVASHSPELVPGRGREIDALTSHIDFVPTIIEWAGGSSEWYTRTYKRYLSSLKNEVKTKLPGRCLTDLVRNPWSYPHAQWGDRRALLFTYDAFNSIDAEIAYVVMTQDEEPTAFHYWRRGVVRGFYDGHIKFARYFSPANYLEQTEVTGSYEDLHEPIMVEGAPYYGQDVQVFYTPGDPHELHNLVKYLDEPTFCALNCELLALMKEELFDPTRTPNTLQNALDEFAREALVEPDHLPTRVADNNHDPRHRSAETASDPRHRSAEIASELRQRSAESASDPQQPVHTPPGVDLRVDDIARDLLEHWWRRRFQPVVLNVVPDGPLEVRDAVSDGPLEVREPVSDGPLEVRDAISDGPLEVRGVERPGPADDRRASLEVPAPDPSDRDYSPS